MKLNRVTPQLFGIMKPKILFVESFARVHRLSLSGKIVYHLRLGHVAVQWPALQAKYPRSKYNSILV
jgi:beta-1,4-N-acetylglucosaminyltransferase